MKYKVDFGPDHLRIALEGAFTFSDVKTFRKLVMHIQSGHDRREIRMDLRDVSLIDLTALGLLMMLFDVSKRGRIDLVFVSPQGQVLELLNQAAAHNAITIAA